MSSVLACAQTAQLATDVLSSGEGCLARIEWCKWLRPCHLGPVSAHIARVELCADVGGQLGERLRLEVVDQYLRAFVDQARTNGAADTSRRSGDYDSLTTECTRCGVVG